MSVEANKRLLQQGFEAWNAGDEQFAAWTRHAIAPDVIVQVPVLTISGVDAYLNYASGTSAPPSRIVTSGSTR